MLKAPPRLLLGVAFLFWGAMGNYPFVGLLGAVVFEARHWTSLRWNFGEKGFVRAWQLCMVILVIVAVRFLSSDDERTAAASLELLSWLPFIFMPLGLAQQYAANRGVPLTSFSYFARRKIKLDREVGRLVRLYPAQIGFPYLGIILVSAGLVSPSRQSYGLGVIFLFGIGLYFMSGERKRPLAWALSYVSAVLLAGFFSWVAIYLYDRLGADRSMQDNELASARETRTQLGQVGKLQLSPTIDWRYFQKEGAVPRRLCLAVYDDPKSERSNFRVKSYWQARNRLRKWVEKGDSKRDVGGGFESLYQKEKSFIYEPEFFEKEASHQSRVVGLVSDESLIPLPRNVLRFDRVATQGIDANWQGSTRLSDPDHGALSIDIESGSQDELSSIDLDPSIRDLEIPLWEFDGLSAYWKTLGVEDLPKRVMGSRGSTHKFEWSARENDRREQEVLLRMMQADFEQNYSYSLELDPNPRLPPVTHFLKDMKGGHCEYFASASALLLRRAGIPTRYAIGYVVYEKGSSPGEFLLRGKHAHAWTQAYFGGTWTNEAGVGKPVWRCRGGEWVDVDLTPSSWLPSSEGGGWLQDFSDWWQTSLADTIVWFSGKVVSFVVKLLLVGALLFILIRVVWSLWKTKGGHTEEAIGSWRARSRSENPLADFETWLAKRVGPRPSSLPLAEWLREKAPELIPLYQEIRFDPAYSGQRDALERGEKDARERLKNEVTKNT